MVDLSLGERPHLPTGEGPHGHAAKFMLRYHEDGVVTQAPGPEEIEELQRRFPGSMADILVAPGQRLSDLHNQDSYSFEVADIYLSADSESELLERYAQATEILHFEVDPVEESLEQSAAEITHFARRETIPE
jgi:hypothetical protein